MNNELNNDSYYEDADIYQNGTSSIFAEDFLSKKHQRKLYKDLHPYIVTVEDEYKEGWGQYVDTSAYWKIQKAIMRYEYKSEQKESRMAIGVRWFAYVWVLWFWFWFVYSFV